MDNTRLEFKIFIIILIGIVILLSYGLYYRLNNSYMSVVTEKDIADGEREYCNKYNMGIRDYVVDDGKESYYKTKCVGVNGERTIDYGDEVFCKYKIKSKKGGC